VDALVGPACLALAYQANLLGRVRGHSTGQGRAGDSSAQAPLFPICL
jgi:hypothetical protein